MPVLANNKHERFAQALFKGKSAADAYTEAGFKPNRANASVLKHKQNIVTRLAEIVLEDQHIHEAATEKAVTELAISKTWVLGMLRENTLIAMGKQKITVTKAIEGEAVDIEVTALNANAANKALELIGKEIGMFKERLDITGTLTLEQLVMESIREEAEQGKVIEGKVNDA